MTQRNVYNFPIHLVLILFLGVSLVQCKSYLHVADINSERYEIEPHQELQEDEAILAIIDPYKKQLDVKMNRVIGENAEKMYKARPEGELGNWVADIIYDQASKVYKGKLDFAIQNHGGLRIPVLDEGPIIVGDVYEVMPFDNELVVIEARGLIVKQLFQRIANKGGWPVSKQVRFVGTQDGEIESLYINSKPFDETATYAFALPDYIANGGDRCVFLENQDQIKFNLLIRDAIINYLDEQEEGVVQLAPREGRIKISKN